MSENSFTNNTTSLKQKTTSGLFWSFTDNFVSQLLHLIVGIILARILSPSEFGLIGMITVFIAVSQSFIDSGFQQALIRKKDATEIDFSTVFYFNIVIGVIFYIILFLSSGIISKFYREPQLKEIIQVFGLVLIINSMALIQRLQLLKAINFKLQTKISFSSSIIAGTVGIYMAYSGFGVWSLVWKTLINQMLQTIALWIFNKWTPVFKFSIRSLREMFSFGSKLFLSGLIDTFFNNIYYFIIGKYFSATELGFYTKADQFNKLASNNITSTIQKVSYPVLSTLQDDNEKLKKGYKKLIINTMYITSILMFSIIVVAKPLVITLLGYKWLSSVKYLQLLCFSGMLFPLSALNLNILKVKGRSDIFLKVMILQKVLVIPVVVIGILKGIEVMIIGIVFSSLVTYLIYSYVSGRLIMYSVKEQIEDIIPSFILASFISILIFIPSIFIQVKPIYMLFIQTILAVLLTISLSHIFNIESFKEIKGIIIKEINSHRLPIFSNYSRQTRAKNE